MMIDRPVMPINEPVQVETPTGPDMFEVSDLPKEPRENAFDDFATCAEMLQKHLHQAVEVAEELKKLSQSFDNSHPMENVIANVHEIHFPISASQAVALKQVELDTVLSRASQKFRSLVEAHKHLVDVTCLISPVDKIARECQRKMDEEQIQERLAQRDENGREKPKDLDEVREHVVERLEATLGNGKTMLHIDQINKVLDSQWKAKKGWFK